MVHRFQSTKFKDYHYQSDTPIVWFMILKGTKDGEKSSIPLSWSVNLPWTTNWYIAKALHNGLLLLASFQVLEEHNKRNLTTAVINRLWQCYIVCHKVWIPEEVGFIEWRYQLGLPTIVVKSIHDKCDKNILKIYHKDIMQVILCKANSSSLVTESTL